MQSVEGLLCLCPSMDLKELTTGGRLQVFKLSRSSELKPASLIHHQAYRWMHPPPCTHTHPTNTVTSACGAIKTILRVHFVLSEMQQKQTALHQPSIFLLLYDLISLSSETDDHISNLYCILTLLKCVMCVFSAISCVQVLFLGVCLHLPIRLLKWARSGNTFKHTDI